MIVNFLNGAFLRFPLNPFQLLNLFKMNLVTVFSAQHHIEDGSRVTIAPGETVRFQNLPNQTIAAVIVNNSDNNPNAHITYANNIESVKVASPQKQGISVGYCYFINPAEANEANSHEIAVTLSQKNKNYSETVDVYLVSVYLPVSGIPSEGLSLWDSKSLEGYSRAYFTPPFAECNLTLKAANNGLVGLLFQDRKVTVIGQKMSLSSFDLSKYVGASPEMANYIRIESQIGDTYDEPFYGTQTQIVYSPIAPVNAANVVEVAVQQF
jgi:hypothetical protein